MDRPSNILPSDGIVSQLRDIVGPEHVITDIDALENYAHDETPGYSAMPALAVKPASTAEVAAVMKLAHGHAVPVTPRGGGTSLSAGAVPVLGGIVLSLERMNRIRDIDQANLMAVVEPGVVHGELDKALAQAGLFFPPDPVSLDSCTIGGNIAENAGGPRAMKYGVTKNYVTGLEVVLCDGTVMRLGGKLLKNVTGYDLIDLIVGSEGTLAVVTEATIRVLPRPGEIIDLLIPLDSVEQASLFAQSVIAAGFLPAVIEFMEGEVVRTVGEYLKRQAPFSDANAHLIVELDGSDKAQMRIQYDRVGEMALRAGARDVAVGQSAADRERIWEVRRKIGEALKSEAAIIAREDLVVPRNRIPELIRSLQTCARNYKATLFAFGHLGDGNIHADVGIRGRREPKERPADPWVMQVRREMYRITVDLGGTITAEHGVGLSKIDFITLALDKTAIDKMKHIKRIFDPANLLNPGKMFP
jgi:glycolate oxidase